MSRSRGSRAAAAIAGCEVSEVQALARDVCVGAAILDASGISQGWGHVSAKLIAPSFFLITPKRLLAGIHPDELELVDLEGHVHTTSSVEGAPSEVALHAALYAARPDIGAIARAQPPHVEAFGVAGVPLTPVHNFGAMCGTPEVFPDSRLISDRATAARVADQMGRADSLILRGNGALAVGADVKAAVVRMMWLEEAAELVLRARVLRHSAGLDTDIHLFDESAVATYRGLFSGQERVQRKWESLTNRFLSSTEHRHKPSP